MTLQQLEYFLATIELGSFSGGGGEPHNAPPPLSGGADELHMAQPSLSEQMRRLEDEMGVALFHRVGRGVALTEAGRALQPHAERTLAEAEAARDAVAGVREVRGGTA